MHTYGANRWKTLDRYFLYPQSESKDSRGRNNWKKKEWNFVLYLSILLNVKYSSFKDSFKMNKFKEFVECLYPET